MTAPIVKLSSPSTHSHTSTSTTSTSTSAPTSIKTAPLLPPPTNLSAYSPLSILDPCSIDLLERTDLPMAVECLSAMQREDLAFFGEDANVMIDYALADTAEALLNATETISMELMNRNRRRVKKANHGARPNNSRGRKQRRLRRS